MKKIYLLMAMLCLIVGTSLGENKIPVTSSSDNQMWNDGFYFGAKLGANYSNVYDREGGDFNVDPKFGLALGVFANFPIGNYFGIQPEILLSQKGYKAEGTLLGSRYLITRTSNYLDIPLLFAFKPIEMVSIVAGPQYSFLLSQKNKFENGVTTIEQEQEFDNEGIRKNTVCFTGGLDLNLDEFVISGRVGWDLFKNNGDGTRTTPGYKNQWYQLTLGYRF